MSSLTNRSWVLDHLASLQIPLNEDLAGDQKGDLREFLDEYKDYIIEITSSDTHISVDAYERRKETDEEFHSRKEYIKSVMEDFKNLNK